MSRKLFIRTTAATPLTLNKVKDDLYVIQDNGSGNVAVYITR